MLKLISSKRTESIFNLLSTCLVICVIAFGIMCFFRNQTLPQSRESPHFNPTRDLTVAFIGDSIATDMIREYQFLKDAFHLLTPSTSDLVLGSDPHETVSLFQYFNLHRPIQITNFSRPGADLFTRHFFNEPPRWQRWMARIPDLSQQIDLFLRSPKADWVVIWTGHVDLLYWNSYVGAMRSHRITQSSKAELQDWLSERWLVSFERELFKLRSWALEASNRRIIVLGTLNWKAVTDVAAKIQIEKDNGSIFFARAEKREDPQGQIALRNIFQKKLAKLVETESHHLGFNQIQFIDPFGELELELEDVKSDGIHPSKFGQKKIVQYIGKALGPIIENEPVH